MTAAQVREIERLQQRVDWLERHADLREDAIATLADRLASTQLELDRERRRAVVRSAQTNPH